MELKKVVVVFLAAIGLISCGSRISPNCSAYINVASDAGKRADIVKWADENVFSANKDDLITGFSFLVGPGKERIKSVRGSAMHVPDAIVSVDPYFKKDSPDVMLVEAKDGRPSVVFVGRKSFEGLLVSKGNMDDYIRLTGEDRRWIPALYDRVAVMCYSD